MIEAQPFEKKYKSIKINENHFVVVGMYLINRITVISNYSMKFYQVSYDIWVIIM